MQITPRYDGPTVLRIEAPLEPGEALCRQMQRFGDAVAGLDEAHWAVPSRCDGWTVRDVVAHLVSVHGFWTVSVTMALGGSPSRFLTGFDPVATPVALVDGLGDVGPAEMLEQYRDAAAGLAAVVAGVDGDAWSSLGEAPPGHIELRAVLSHALWDAWTHERDAFLPLGSTPPIEDDEVRACLLYSAAVGPALALAGGAGRDRHGTLGIDATDPALRFVVEVDGDSVTVREVDDLPVGPALRGTSVDLIEGLSFRAPLVHDLDAEHAWLLAGLDAAFDRETVA